MRFSNYLLLLIVALSITACGQMGPLYLPEDAAPKPPIVQTNTQINTQPAASITQPAK